MHAVALALSDKKKLLRLVKPGSLFFWLAELSELKFSSFIEGKRTHHKVPPNFIQNLVKR